MSVDDVELGKQLIARGLVAQDAVRAVYASLAPGQRLGPALVARGMLAPAALHALQGDPTADSSATLNVPPPTAPTLNVPPPGPGLVGSAPGSSASLPQPGEVVDGRFRVERPLGQGGMGAVFAGQDLQRGLAVAIKFVLPGQADEDALRRFEREAQLAARVDRHEAVARVEAFGTWRGLPYSVMELIEGEELEASLERGLEPTVLAGLVEQIARGLAACHAAGVVHRDVKPANVIVTPQGRAKLLDFGLAVTADVERLTKTGALLGTPHYMAPEQADNAQDVDGQADVYSLGAILYRGLCGRVPFDGDPREILHKLLFVDPPAPSKVLPGASADLEAVCLQAMAKEPGDRYEGAAALAEDLARFVAGEPVQARPLSGWQRFRRRYRRREPRAVAVVRSLQAAVLLAVLAAATHVVFFWAPGVANRESAWTEQLLRKHWLGVRGEPLPLGDAELVERQAALNRVRVLLNAEKTHSADRALTLLEAHRRLLAAQAGEEVKVPHGVRDRDPAHVVVDAQVEIARGDWQRACRRLEELTGGAGAESTFVPARLLLLRLRAEHGDPQEALRLIPSLQNLTERERAFMLAQAKRAVARGLRELLEEAPGLDRIAVVARGDSLMGVARDLPFGTDWLREAKVEVLEESAPAWSEQVGEAARALRRGDRAKIVEVVHRLGDVVQRIEPAVRPGPKLRAVMTEIESAALAAQREAQDVVEGQASRLRADHLAATVVLIGQLLFYEVDPQRQSPAAFYDLLENKLILRVGQGKVELDVFLACLRANFARQSLVPSNRKFLEAVDPSKDKRQVQRDLAALARQRPRSRAVRFVQLLVRFERNDHKLADRRGEMIAETRALLELSKTGLPDLAKIYQADVHGWLSKLLIREAIGRRDELSEEARRALLEESLVESRRAQADVARFHWFGLKRDEDLALRELNDREGRVVMWKAAIEQLRAQLEDGTTANLLQEIGESHLFLGKAYGSLNRPAEARAAFEEGLRVVLRTTHVSSITRARAQVALLAVHEGRLEDARDALGEVDEAEVEDSGTYAEAWARYALAIADRELAERVLKIGLRGNPANKRLKGLRDEAATMGGQ